ncbi:1-deoxy-D-xylulose-5-phosphate reductoisomerase [Streptomyces sp. AK02-01A]|uniref:1-deoxy-D-xylulose-5-phosphate reductoisomerase n=1 Tax=Streptomyces sp. AK02-01A TaxID=3028648 RepID=UPI0029AF1195|nr:1-deoxy-D-xylulose-5-phosphate reductoisomerase [Streptomyces sp. AK02-01A]MDX3853135.1 1-deoxy-D-xylulose-5-phosphate reductoisomerase [Streptomyces sp. AK02-01A]
MTLSAPARRSVVLLGSTGSVGSQAVDLMADHRDRFEVRALCAAGNKLDVLAAQAARLEVAFIGIADQTKAVELDALCRAAYPPEVPLPEIVAGRGAAVELTGLDSDVVLNAIDGSPGLRPTLAALDAGRTVALANKESLIIGGRLVTDRAGPGQIVPVDSEHSALAQCLRGADRREVARLVLTASGGPFRGYKRPDLTAITAQQALAHPTWSMGPGISTNSATLMNKGLEIIEAHLLFGIAYGRIEAVVHPQSAVHSMVEFSDGSMLAQCSSADMRLPIAAGLDWPRRVPGAVTPLDWTACHDWHFEPVDHVTFPAVDLARTAGIAGECAPAVLNTANEFLVAAFLRGEIGFLDIIDLVSVALYTWLDTRHSETPADGLEAVESAQTWARDHAQYLVKR